MSGERLLVPLSRTDTVRQTVEYAVSRLVGGDGGIIRFIYVHPPDGDSEEIPAAELERDLTDANALLDRATVWAREDAGNRSDSISIETGHVGLDRFLFSPEDVADALVTEYRDEGMDAIILDPEYNPGVGSPLVRPLERELEVYEGIEYTEAPISRQTRRAPLLKRSTPLQIGSLFLVSIFFYMVLAADPFYWFEWVTGIIAATVVAVGLSRVTFSEDPTQHTLARIGRHIVYIPYLLLEIIKSNIAIAAVILHPRLPIEPRLTRVRAAVWGGLPITTFANSVTLTPGTLSVRIDDEHLIIHTLVPSAREDLFDGGLERAVRFVFYGRKAMNIPSPRERGDTEILQQPRQDKESDVQETDTQESTDDELESETSETKDSESEQ